jgi:hypothetical protein
MSDAINGVEVPARAIEAEADAHPTPSAALAELTADELYEQTQRLKKAAAKAAAALCGPEDQVRARASMRGGRRRMLADPAHAQPRCHAAC